MNNAAAVTAIENATGLLAIIYAGVDALPAESRLADGIALALDHLADELSRARTAHPAKVIHRLSCKSKLS